MIKKDKQTNKQAEKQPPVVLNRRFKQFHLLQFPYGNREATHSINQPNFEAHLCVNDK